MSDTRQPLRDGRLFSHGQSFTTTREELFERLVLAPPTGYVVTEGEYGPGRKYHITIADLMDAFFAFCTEKEEAA